MLLVLSQIRHNQEEAETVDPVSPDSTHPASQRIRMLVRLTRVRGSISEAPDGP